MKTKLLLTISIICLLLASTQAAIPYEYFPDRSEADGETPGAQIPNCINQRGPTCLACGPDTSKTPAVPLFPNGVNQCIPNPTGSGCNRFLDVQGNVCDVRQGCNCKFVLNSVATTCVASTIPNCFILAADGTCNQCIGLNRSAAYKDRFGSSQTLDQNTPVGGGVSDYGRSFDGKTCIDNLANGNSNCLEYLNDGKSCSKCDENRDFLLVQTGTPTASLRKCIRFPGFIAKSNCIAHSLDGLRCITCDATKTLNGSGDCVNPPADSNFTPTATFQATSANCLRYAKGPDGKDTTRCLKCVKFSFQLQDRSCSLLLENENQEINYITGARTDNQGSDCRLFYQATFYDQTTGNNQLFKFCLVKKAANDYYIPQNALTDPESTYVARANFNCKNFDLNSGKCLICNDGYYLNTLNGACHSTTGDCKLLGCKQASGYAYCTLCQIGYNLVDGFCVQTDLGDALTNLKCITVTNGECTACDPRYFLDVKGSLSNDSLRNKCVDLGAVTGCATTGWAAGKCTTCAEKAQVLVNNQCVWAPDTEFGGVPGCATFSEDGKCLTTYPYAFLSKEKTFTRIITNECASYDEDGNCTSVNSIDHILNFDYSTGLFVSQSKGSGGYCDKSYDGGCTCVSCKPTFTLSSSKTCPANLTTDVIPANIVPNTVIRGCIEFATASTCKVCRSPDFIITTDGQCYDLSHNRKRSGATGWVGLFIQKTGAYNAAYSTVYTPPNYEACTTASNIYTCTACFNARPNNIIPVTLETNAYFGSANAYCHDNTNAVFISSASSLGVFVNDGVTTARDTTSLILKRVSGCLTYTSLVLGTCANCRADLTKTTDNMSCVKKYGVTGEGTESDCGTIDASDGQCSTCPDTQQWIYDSTNKICYRRFSDDEPDFQFCLTQDFATGKCLSCIPSRIFTVSTNSASTICKSVLDVTDLGCNGSQCHVGLTATYVPAVVTPTAIAEKLQLASCGKGYTFDSTNKLCTRNKTDWSQVSAIDANSGLFTACTSDHTLFKAVADKFNYCIPAIANCVTHTFASNQVFCSACSIDANGIPFQLVNTVQGQLCIPAQNYLQNCDIYNSSGSGCLQCSSEAKNLESSGCNLPPNCSEIDPYTLRCVQCLNQFKLTPQGNCILPLNGKWAASSNCAQAFNSTHCAECTGANRILTIDDTVNDNLYGVGECVDFTSLTCKFPGCELALRRQDQQDCTQTSYECIRCMHGYSIFGGQCYNNYHATSKSQVFPRECVNVEYDEDQKDYVCTECDFGFAITTDRKQCIPNYGPCSYLDSTDCASYELPKGHQEVQIECASERESSSIIISASLMIILNIIMLVI